MIGDKTSFVNVDGKLIETHCREIISANILSVEAGTNGYHGGDSHSGCRTYFSIKDNGSTDMRVHVKNTQWGDTEGAELIFGGDCELSTVIKALKFIVNTLEEQIEEKRRWTWETSERPSSPSSPERA